MDRYLVYAVTAFGFLLAVLGFAVIFMGKRIPGDRGAPQQVEFRGFKVKTNGVVALLLVCVIMTALPLSLQAWVEIQKRKEPPPAPPKAQDMQLYITGQVLNVEGPVEGAKVTVTNIRNVKPGEPELPLASRLTDGSGSFDFPALPFGEGDRYRVVAAKEGHVEQCFYMGPGGAIDVKTVLVAKPRTGGAP